MTDVVALRPLSPNRPAANAPRPDTRPPGAAALWFVRTLACAPFLCMLPELLAAATGRPDAAAALSVSTADVLGSASLLCFMLMLAVTPVHTVTGWTWHLPLRRDLGLAMFATAMLDLVIAAATTGDTFDGGVPGRIAGRSFLLVGTLATVLLIPLALTANRRSMRRLGSHWRRLHRLVYVVWGLVLVHLLLLFDLGGPFRNALLMSVPLALLRVPVVDRWFRTTRTAGRARALRAVVVVLLVATFAAGFVPAVQSFVTAGRGALALQPEGN